ncbi:MAG: squalene/phytoene synthase family protein [Planctomycetota bacterium]|nr:squalene/phytoene synthase family protein [Planctomycetota bacterium]
MIKRPSECEHSDEAFCRAMLPKVSRTFAACIGLLPPGLEFEVLIAYLLCRIADTAEDTETLSPETKRELLQHIAHQVSTAGTDASPLAATFAEPRNDDELLTRDADRVFRAYAALDATRREAIRPWVVEMCDGMADFALAHPGAAPGTVDALDDLSDLDRYCYYVAGTVGHLLTDLFALHHHRVTPRHVARMKKLATSFGLGLQLTNIIKDVADDRSRGWSFVPRRLCEALGTSPEHFLDSSDTPAAESVMATLIDKAQAHLDDARDYCLALPRSQYRIRIFCLTPLFFAVRTLALARRDPRLLDPNHKVKITRPEVKQTIRDTFLVAPNNALVRQYYRRLCALR